MVLEEVVDTAPKALETVENALPNDFPTAVSVSREQRCQTAPRRPCCRTVVCVEARDVTPAQVGADRHSEEIQEITCPRDVTCSGSHCHLSIYPPSSRVSLAVTSDAILLGCCRG